jgi:hypothetical protein
MGFLDDVINKSVPQGSSLAKPLMLAFIALLASGALTRKQAPASAPGTSAAPGADAGGGCWADWVDCSVSFRRAILAT